MAGPLWGPPARSRAAPPSAAVQLPPPLFADAVAAPWPTSARVAAGGCGCGVPSLRAEAGRRFPPRRRRVAVDGSGNRARPGGEGSDGVSGRAAVAGGGASEGSGGEGGVGADSRQRPRRGDELEALSGVGSRSMAGGGPSSGGDVGVVEHARRVGAVTTRSLAEVEAALAYNPALVARLAEMEHALLYTAAHSGHKEVVEVLLCAGAAVDATTEERWTSLHAAAQDGHKEVVEVLLRAGAAVDATTKEG
ncbi:hypothetical protein MMPV_008968 [Pyropia vietnamensis]